MRRIVDMAAHGAAAGSRKELTMDGGLLSIVTIAGPILLAAVMLWAVAHNRRSRAQKRMTEEATRMRREERQEEKARSEGSAPD